MHGKGSNTRLSTMASRSRIPTLLLFMFSTFATIYVAGRLALFFSMAFCEFVFVTNAKFLTFLIFFFFFFLSQFLVGLVYRLWQDSQNRVYLIKELDRITGLVGISCYASILLRCACFGIFMFIWDLGL